jgi:predicted phage terminase large subunit-like protein
MKVTLPPLHALQKMVATHPARFKILVCGRRWGKTRLGSVMALKAALEGKRVWWVAPTYSISTIAWQMIRPMASQLGGEIAESTRTAKFPTGGFISCKSGDQPNNLRGESLDLVILDEADFLDEIVWTEVLRPALADRKGQAVMISTPNIEGGWFHSLFQKGQDGTQDIISWQFPSASNPYLDPEELEAARASIPEIVYRREFLAEFVSSSGALLKEAWLQTGNPPLRDQMDVTIGVDLAISTKDGADYTACVAIGRQPDGHIWILDAQRTRQPFDGVLRFIKGFCEAWNPSIVAIEQVQYQAAVVTELLRTTNLPVMGIRPDKDKVTRFYPLQARFEQGMVFLSRDLPQEYRRELLGFPVGAHDDMVDATVYAYRAGLNSGIQMT